MRKQLLAMASATILGLAGAASAPLSAGAVQIAPGLGSQANSNIIQVQVPSRDGDGQRRGITRSGGQRPQPGASSSSRGDFQGGKATSQRGIAAPSRQVQGRTVQRQNVQRQDFSTSRRSVERSPRVTVQHRIVRQGWSRDRRNAYYGAYLLGIPFGYAAYASNPCYDWVVGPQGPGYYWNYGRCPV
jgi:hypothetical protein